MRRICVLGAGTIGSLFAAHLARIAEVWVVVRRSEHARDIMEHGLRVSGKAEFTASLTATVDASVVPPFDLAVVATKAPDIARVMAGIAERSPHALFMTSQNGLGADEVVAGFGPWPVLSAVTFMSGTRHSDRHVEYELDAPTWLGPASVHPASTDAADETASLLVAAGLRAEAFEDVAPALWSKLIFNATVNAVSALTGLPHDQHFRQQDALSDLGHLVHALVDEGKAVADAAGIKLFEDPWAMNLEAVARGESGQGHYRHLPSMLEDVLARRPTEVDFITGRLVQEGLRRGVPVPLHLALYRLLTALEASWAARP